MANERSRSLLLILALGVLFAATVAARTAHYGRFVQEGRALIADPDSVYHLRLARVIDHQYPSVPSRDSYLNYPGGAEILWPFLQDLTTATVNHLGPWRSDGALERICFFYPAVMAGLAAVLVFLWSSSLGMGQGGALLGALFTTLIPAQIAYSFGGMYDHHAGDLAYALLFFFVVTRAWGLRSRPFSEPGTLVTHVVLAVATVAMFLNWLGSSIYVVMLAAAVAAWVALGRTTEDRSRPVFLQRLGASLGLAALLLGATLLAVYGPGRMIRVESERPTAFYPLLLAGAASCSLLGAMLLREGRGALRRVPFWAVAGIALAVAAVMGGAFLHAFDYYLVVRRGPLATISEFSPLFLQRNAAGDGWVFTFSKIGMSVSWALLLCPLFVAGIWRRGMDGQGSGRGFPALLFLSVFLIQTLMALRQYRYANVLAAPLAMGTAWLATQAFVSLRGAPPDLSRVLRAGGVWLAVAAGISPGPWYLKTKLNDPYRDTVHAGIMRSMAWLASNTPPPSDYFDPAAAPAYGVMAPWDIGHNVIGAGRRPAIATGYLDALPGDYFRQSAEFFVAEDPESARDIMERNRLRYVVMYNHENSVRWSALISGRTDLGQALANGGITGLYDTGAVPVSVRLWSSAGSAVDTGRHLVGGTKYFRLLWRDYFRYPDGTLDTTMIFGLVPGATLTGKAPPGRPVAVVLGLQDNLGSSFVYRDVATADAAGWFALTVPYPTDGPSGAVRPTGPYRVQVKDTDAVAEVRLDENAVQKAARIQVFR
ncbi:MAG TPA: STT3 domain-containing protein [bacterium]